MIDGGEFRGHPMVADAGLDGDLTDAPDAAIVLPDSAPPIDVFDIDAPVLPDADTSMFTVTGHEGELVEGAGDDYGGVPLIFKGTSFSNTTITIATADAAKATIVAGSTVVAADGKSVLVLVRVKVDPALADGVMGSIMFVLQQTGAASAVTRSVPVKGLDELTVTGNFTVPATLKPRYSEVKFSAGNINLSGLSARFVSMKGVAVTANVHADGMGTAAGAGGCAGGAAGSPGQCGDSGGDSGTSGGQGSGGGGGGNGTVGMAGAGTPNSGGAISPIRLLEILGGATGARGHGGGGGGSGTLGGGGTGGGGGGVLEITTEGMLFYASSVITADGEDGTSGGGLGVCGTSGGGGGGGSGGAILLRSFVGITATGGMIGARAGVGGPASGSCRGGGAGGAGIVRLDTPMKAGVAIDPTTAEIRGPMFDTSLNRVVRTGTTTMLVPVVAGPLQNFWISAGGGALMPQQTDQNGSANVPVTLVKGINTICLHITSGAVGLNPEAKNCRDVAYIP